jgi:hypothetical protein
MISRKLKKKIREKKGMHLYPYPYSEGESQKEGE